LSAGHDVFLEVNPSNGSTTPWNTFVMPSDGSPAGLHRARLVDVFAWCDSGMASDGGTTGGGAIYDIVWRGPSSAPDAGSDAAGDAPADGPAEAGCTGPADCPLGLACSQGQCGVACSASSPCNGGCCGSGTCVPGTSAAACGQLGLCTSCASSAAGHACIALPGGGTCGCTTDGDCASGSCGGLVCN
jgi:hypothetical protein